MAAGFDNTTGTSHNAAYCHCDICQGIREHMLRPKRIGTQAQPAPEPNHNPAIVDLVIIDMLDRKRFGQTKYGVELQAHNGRDPMVDAYHEALDLCMYLRQAIEERGA